MAASILPVVLKARGQHTATLIFLHGLGDTGHGWAGMLNTVRPDYLKIVCPNAPSIPVTMNQGFVMPAWYDIKDLAQDKSSVREDLNGVESSTKVLEALIDMEARELKNNSAGKSRILVGGFSQGGAVALNAILRAKEHFAGGLALSTYIAGDKVPEVETKIQTPILHCHGLEDQMISIQRGRLTSQALTELVQDYKFHTFPDMGHECSQEELDIVKNFIQEKLPPLPLNNL